jgi:hypothetical protein
VFIGLLAIDAQLKPSRSGVAVNFEPSGSARPLAEPSRSAKALAERAVIDVIVRIAAGVALAAAPLLIYNALAFGSPFHLGYASEEGFKELQTGFFGITYPRLSTIRELLARKGRPGPALVAGGIGVYYLLLNASYFYWEGGWAFGPRQMTPALPFLALGLAPLWDRGRTVVRALLVGGLIWGAALTLVAVSTTPQPPATFASPMRELLWPAFRDGDLSLNPQTFVHNSVDVGHLRGGGDPHAAWNLGELAGLRGLRSLLPLAFIWVAAAALLIFL